MCIRCEANESRRRRIISRRVAWNWHYLDGKIARERRLAWLAFIG